MLPTNYHDQQSTDASYRPAERDTGWARPRNDSTAANDSLAEITNDGAVRSEPPVHPLESVEWPVGP